MMKLEYKELKEQHPKAMVELEKWIKKSLETFQEIQKQQLAVGTDVEMPEIKDEHVQGATEVLLTSYYRTLMDFFDKNKIFLTTDYIFEEGFVVSFAGWKPESAFISRVEAEIVAIKAAFEALEGHL